MVQHTAQAAGWDPVDDHGLGLVGAETAQGKRGHHFELAGDGERYSPRVRAGTASTVLELAGADGPAVVGYREFRQSCPAG
jgi:hypothetical protein